MITTLLALIRTNLLEARSQAEDQCNTIKGEAVVIIPFGDFIAWIDKLVKLTEKEENEPNHTNHN